MSELEKGSCLEVEWKTFFQAQHGWCTLELIKICVRLSLITMGHGVEGPYGIYTWLIGKGRTFSVVIYSVVRCRGSCKQIFTLVSNPLDHQRNDGGIK